MSRVAFVLVRAGVESFGLFEGQERREWRCDEAEGFGNWTGQRDAVEREEDDEHGGEHSRPERPDAVGG